MRLSSTIRTRLKLLRFIYEAKRPNDRRNKVYNSDMQKTADHKLLGVTLNRTLSYEDHISNPSIVKSKHTHLLDPKLNQACKLITRCLKPTNVYDFCLFAGIAPSDIRRNA